MGDVHESGEVVAEGAEPPTGAPQGADMEAALIQEYTTEPAAGQEGTGEHYDTHEGASERAASQEDTGEQGTTPPAISQEAARDPNTSREGSPDQKEGTREPDTSQEAARDPNTSQEAARDPNTSREGAPDLDGGIQEPDTSQEAARDPNTSQEAARDPNTSQEAARDPNTSQEGAPDQKGDIREPYTGQEAARDPNTSPEGAQEPDTSHEIAKDPNTSPEGGRDQKGGTQESDTSQEAARDLNTSQEGDRDLTTNQEDTKEPSTSQEGTRESSAGHTKDIEPKSALEEDGKTGITESTSSLQQAEEPGGSTDDPSETHHETEEYIPKGDVLKMAEKTDQEPSLEPKEDTHLLGEQEEAEQNQDCELQEKVDDDVDDEQIREELIEQYHTLVQDRDKIQQHNGQLQHKLYEYFRKKKGEETRSETLKGTTDQEQRYLKYLTNLEEMRRKYREEGALHQHQIEELSALCQDIVSKLNKEWTTLQEQKKKIALCSLSKRGVGKHAASSLIQEVELLQSREERKEKEVIQVRLENIKLKNQISRYESTLRSKEELADGLHLIDFEQLKIENQTYNEKIEERNEELQKFKKKITNTVQVLTHVKEKLQFVQAENQIQKEKLMEVEALVGKKRDLLTKTKQARDSLRTDNLKLKQKCGLLGNKVLLRDFEDKVDSIEELRQTLENLKRRHAELTLSSKGLMKKVNEAKQVMDG